MSVLAAGGLKSQCVMISTAPNCGEGGGGVGIRSSVGMLAAPFRPLYKRISLLSLLLFMRDSHFSFSRIPVLLPVSKQWLQTYIIAALFLTFSISC